MHPSSLSRWFPGFARAAAPALLASFLASPLAAQWKVKTRHVTVEDDSGQVVVKVPVVVGKGNPSARRAMNQTLFNASGADRTAPSDYENADFDDHFEVGLSDRRILSLYFEFEGQFSEAAHGFRSMQGYTFDAQTGKPIGMDNLLTGDWRPAVHALLVESLKSDLTHDGVDISGLDTAVEQSEWGFYLEKKAISVYFPQGTIVGTAGGVLEEEIPYGRLEAFIAPRSPLFHLLKQGVQRDPAPKTAH